MYYRTNNSYQVGNQSDQLPIHQISLDPSLVTSSKVNAISIGISKYHIKMIYTFCRN